MKNFSLNDFYVNLNEAFTELEAEFVDKEEYRNAGIMLEARMLIQHERELNNILSGNNIIYTTSGTEGNSR
jgi:hypothetical protein